MGLWILLSEKRCDDEPANQEEDYVNCRMEERAFPVSFSEYPFRKKRKSDEEGGAVRQISKVYLKDIFLLLSGVYDLEVRTKAP